MTLAQLVEVCRRRHNAESDTYWSDAEIYQLITNRCNEIISYIGLLEATDVSNTSTSGTQEVDYPADAVTIAQVNYKADRLKRITFRQWEAFKTETTTQSGTPEMWVPWNRQILLVPIPDTTNDAITIYYYKEHPYIDGVAQTTVDIPSVLHGHLATGVIADMYAKDENSTMFQQYEQKWNQVAVPAFYRFKAHEDQGGQFQVTADSDWDSLEWGIV